MNTLGKILVVLNLVFTLAVFAFIVFFVAASRGQYAENLENQKKEVVAAKAAVKASGDVNRTLMAKYITAVAERDKYKNDLVDLAAESKAKLAAKDLVIDEKDKELVKHNVYYTKLQEEIDRRNKEVKDLGVALKDREATILELEEESRGYRAEAVAWKNKADTALARAANLLEQIRQMTVQAAKDRVGTATTNGVKRPNEPNPPSALVKGTVDRVETKDPDTVLLSVGSDQGLERNHTLYAYRMDPEPTYLGMVRIVDVHHQSAVGRLERSSVSRRIPLRAGDKVVSDLKFR